MNTCDDSVNISVLEDMFNVINKSFYGNKLRKPNIRIDVIHGRKKSRVACDVFEIPNGKRNADFAVDGSILYDVEKVFKEMLRCCYVLYAHQEKIEITSRNEKYGNGSYGNERYLINSLGKGIIVERKLPYEKYGYEIVDIDNEAKKLIDIHNWYLTLKRDKYTYGDDTQTAHIQNKNVCPICGNINRDTKESSEFLCFNCFKEIFKDDKEIILRARQCKMIRV